MKQEKRFNFSHRVEKLKGEAAYEILSKVQELEKKGKKIIHLEIGQPDFETPKIISKAAIKAIEEGKTKYTYPLGILKLRSVIAQYIGKRNNVKISSRMVGVTPSAKMAIYLAMTAILEPGDEVIYPDPGFPIYGNLTEFLGCIHRPIPLIEEKGFNFDLETFKGLLNKKTKLIILNSPNNPTGSVIPRKTIIAISEMVKKYNIWVLSDEIYSEMIYGREKYESIYSVKGMQERTILIDGFSKTYAMTGWRLGYLIFPEQFSSMINNLSVNSFACVADFTQYAGIVALEKGHKYVNHMTREFEKRKNFIVRELNKIPGISCVEPKGAFYVFPNIMALKMSSQKLVDYFLEKAGVALLPGTAFGKYGEGYLRISYANSIGNIDEAIKRMKEAVLKL